MTFGATISPIQQAINPTDHWQYCLSTMNISWSVSMHFTWNERISFCIVWFAYLWLMFYQFYCRLLIKYGCSRQRFYLLYIQFIARFNFCLLKWQTLFHWIWTTGCLWSSWTFWANLFDILDCWCVDNDARTAKRFANWVFILVKIKFIFSTVLKNRQVNQLV